FLSASKLIEVDNALDISLGLNNFDHHKS
ncbi:PemK family transcriptional regulator, partial [Staphylococcus epidermidis]